MALRRLAVLGQLWLVVFMGGATPLSAESNMEFLRLQETNVVIPQVDFEGAIFYEKDDPLPHLDFRKIGWDRVVKKSHRAILLENEYLQVMILPEMGRVYSMVFKPTGSETLWHNDVARPGKANNPTGWWLWLGGIEYTLAGDEHGTTWALPWQHKIVEDSLTRKALRIGVKEPITGLKESITFSLYPGISYLEAEVQINNPGSETVEFAHWVNPMWAPGGLNELTDHTEFILPTSRILVEKRWQMNLGPSPQPWPDNPLRYIENWKIGDIMADGLEAGFYGTYSHEKAEGVVRVFDPLKNPGVDIWTYGFHPENIPMGSGSPSKGYVEMWGGTVRHFPNELDSLGAGSFLQWTEWIYPIQKTSGLSHANKSAAANLIVNSGEERAEVYICPTRNVSNAVLELQSQGRVLRREKVDMSPAAPYQGVFGVSRESCRSGLTLVVRHEGKEYVRCTGRQALAGKED